MSELFIKKENLNHWIAKYFDKDLISIEDLIGCIEDLDREVERLKEQIEDITEDRDENYISRFRDKYEEYGISEKDFY